MVKVGLIGIGFMGRGHLDNYIKLENEGFPVKLVAVCDIDEKKFGRASVDGNLDVGKGTYDFSKYHIYTDIDEMLKKEALDYVDIALPTYLHAEASIKALNNGLHVFCEKPMARSSKECEMMIEAAKGNNKKLMIGHCLRFWPEYEYLDECIKSKRYGRALGAYFYRGGCTPIWSYQNWLLKRAKSGGALLDQHVHDVDTINWLFGIPKAVSTIGQIAIEGDGYDILSTNYLYDGIVVNAQDDWVLNGDYGFKMKFRVNFEKGNLIYENGVLKDNPNDNKSFVPELSKESAYYREIKHFINCVIYDKPIEIATGETSMQTIKIAEAEEKSADNGGCFTKVLD